MNMYPQVHLSVLTFSQIYLEQYTRHPGRYIPLGIRHSACLIVAFACPIVHDKRASRKAVHAASSITSVANTIINRYMTTPCEVTLCQSASLPETGFHLISTIPDTHTDAYAHIRLITAQPQAKAAPTLYMSSVSCDHLPRPIAKLTAYVAVAVAHPVVQLGRARCIVPSNVGRCLLSFCIPSLLLVCHLPAVSADIYIYYQSSMEPTACIYHSRG